MGGDYTRFTFDPRRGYNSLLRQQGRVAVDADHNEAAEAADRRWRSETFDLLSVEEGGPAGLCVVPRSTPDAFLVTPGGGSFTLGVGRAYVDGIQIENFGAHDGAEAWNTVLAELYGTDPTPYEAQPFLSSHADHPHLPEPPALPAEPYLVYLDVWYREVDALIDPDIREKALGGPDHGTRWQTVWQVRTLTAADLGDGSEPSCDLDFTALEATAPSAGRLTTATEAPEPGENPCILSPEGGYRGRENRLYRVEIHDVAADGSATWKWSRDNASVKSAVTAIEPAVATLEDAANNPVAKNVHRLTVSSLGRDSVLRFLKGGWVEVLDERIDLDPSRTGTLARIVDIDEAERWLTLDRELPPEFDTADPGSRITRVVRWDQTVTIADESADPQGSIDVQTGVAAALEDGISVTFSLDPAGGRFRIGDHWLFAARAIDSSVDALVAAPPRGIHHHYAPLGIVDGGTLGDDCREPWPPEGGEGCCTVIVHPGDDIQAAIDSLPPEGGCVCLKAGEHEIEAPVRIDRSGVHLHGESLGARVVRRDGGALLLEIIAATDVVVVSIAWLAEVGDEPAPPSLVHILYSTRVALRDCRFEAEQTPGSAAALVLGVNILGIDITLHGCGIHGVPYGVMAIGGARLTVEGCDLTGQPTTGPEAAPAPFGELGILAAAAGRARIRDNRFDGFQTAVVVTYEAVDSLIEANGIERAPLAGAEDDDKRYAVVIMAPGTLARDNVIAVPGSGQGGIRLAAQGAHVETNWIAASAGDGAVLPIGVLVEDWFQDDPLFGPESGLGFPFPGIESGLTETLVALPGHFGELRGDGMVVADNRIHGPQHGVVVRGTRGTVVRGNHLDCLVPTAGTVGITLDDAEEARICGNRIDRHGGGVLLQDGAGNEVRDNRITGVEAGILASNEQDLVASGNQIDDAEIGGCLGLNLQRTATFADNHLIRCGWRGVADGGMGFGIGVLFATGEVKVRGCQIVDTGVPPDGEERTAAVAYGIAAGPVIFFRAEGNTVAFTQLPQQDPTREDRAIVTLGWLGASYLLGNIGRVSLALGSALILGNELLGPGRSCLVEILRIEIPLDNLTIGLIFDRVTCSNNHCEHLAGPPDDRFATVRLHGGEMIVMGNHVKSTADGIVPSPFFSFDFNGHPRVAMTGNVSTGGYLQLGGSVPANPLDFNIRLIP